MKHYAVRSKTLVAGRPDAPREVLVFHGYTGSPDEFHYLAEDLAERLNARVTIPLLPGHGTNEAELLHLDFDVFLNAARKHAREVIERGKPYAIIGHSFGGYLAALITEESERKPEAIVFSVTPYVLRFPYSLRFTAWLMSKRQLWDKKLPVQEKIARIGLFFYQNMPGIGLSLVQEGNRRMKKALSRINVPTLIINTENDPLVHPRTCEKILKESERNLHSMCIVLENREHGVFYGDGWMEPIEHIGAYLQKIFQ